MTHQEKLERMHQHMAELGVRASTAAPPLWRLFWRAGLEIPPPLFIPFLPGALAFGAFFGVFWGLAMWLLYWARQGVALEAVWVIALIAGALFGIIMAAYMRFLARKYGLPSWSKYCGASRRT